MKKKYTVSKKDKKDWNAFIKQKKRVYDKDINLSDNSLATSEVRKLDLHGFSLNDANKIVRKFGLNLYRCYEVYLAGSKSSFESYSDQNVVQLLIAKQKDALPAINFSYHNNHVCIQMIG